MGQPEREDILKSLKGKKKLTTNEISIEHDRHPS